MHASRAARERGQALPLVLVLLVFALASAGVVMRIGVWVAQREQAVHAADATALAGALGREPAAQAVARANGAVLEAFAQVGDTVVVRLRRGRFVAAARAERVVEEGPR